MKATYRVEFAHPVTRERVRLMLRSELEAAQVRERIRELTLALQLGQKTEGEVAHELRRLQPSRRSLRTLREAAEAYANDKAPRTRARVLSFFDSARGPFASLGARSIETLDRQVISEWIDTLHASYRGSSIASLWRVLSAIVSWAVDHRWLELVPWGSYSPMRTLDTTPRQRACVSTPEDAARLLEGARLYDGESHHKVPSLHARIACGLLLGLRAGEISGLRWCDLSPGALLVTVAQQYDGEAPKTGEDTLRAPAELFALLEEHRARLEFVGLYTPTGPVFPDFARSRYGQPAHYTRPCLGPEDVRRAVRAANLPNAHRWTVHSLRDSFVCLELIASGSIAHAMQRARHRSLRSTQHYIRALVKAEPQAPAWSLPPAPKELGS